MTQSLWESNHLRTLWPKLTDLFASTWSTTFRGVIRNLNVLCRTMSTRGLPPPPGIYVWGAGLFMCLFSRHSETFLCVPFDPRAFLAVRFVRGGPGEDWRGWKRDCLGFGLDGWGWESLWHFQGGDMHSTMDKFFSSSEFIILPIRKRCSIG